MKEKYINVYKKYLFYYNLVLKLKSKLKFKYKGIVNDIKLTNIIWNQYLNPSKNMDIKRLKKKTMLS